MLWEAEFIKTLVLSSDDTKDLIPVLKNELFNEIPVLSYASDVVLNLYKFGYEDKMKDEPVVEASIVQAEAAEL